nr:type II toxin-antitoxin system RelE/ParE family toxin [Luteibacter rhizovicinus]
MYEIIHSEVFRRWINGLRDRGARGRIDVRLRRLSLGHLGDVKHVGEGVREMRVDYGPGYRIYFIHRAAVLIVLLCGGDKRTQQSDILRATTLAKAWEKHACKRSSLGGIPSNGLSLRPIKWLTSMRVSKRIQATAASFVLLSEISRGHAV